MSNKVYIVTSVHRSGSSMMMRCLEAGGLTAVYDKTIDRPLNESSKTHYVPNPNGFYQYNRQVMPDFYEANKGKLVKLYFSELFTLPAGEYEIIFMKRNDAEIRMSMQRWMPFAGWGVASYFVDEILGALRTKFPSMKVVNYEDVVKNPLDEFIKLNLPINPVFAAAMVEPELHRLRLEK